MRYPTVGDARRLCDTLQARAVIMLSICDTKQTDIFIRGQVAGASYGQTKKECAEAGALLDRIVDLIEQLRNPVQEP